MISLMLLSLIASIKGCATIETDLSGYLTYCPCMGRFGNQADHFLGSLAFAKAINRTLVLPPWVEYHKGRIGSVQVPFDEYFEVEPLKNYHNVILMDDFMKNLAPKIWPTNERVSFCYQERKSLDKSNVDKDCHAKDGNPFGPFWDTYNISFIGSVFYGPLLFDVHHSRVAEKWRTKYPVSKWPILAFTGAPASFPVQSENRSIQRYLVWSLKYRKAAKNFIDNELRKGAFIGVHLRNGIDWVRACEHVKDSQQLFASPQCLDYNNQRGGLYADLCMPPKELILKQLKRLVKSVKQTNKLNEVRWIFVASDSNHMLDDINRAMIDLNVTAHKLPIDNPHLDLAILGIANYFIGNCISSFSAFVKRGRDVNGFPSYFWAFPKERGRHGHKKHEEL